MKTKFYFYSLAIFLLISSTLIASDGAKEMIDGPTAVCQDITIELNENGLVSINPADVDGGSFADGSIDSIIVIPNNFNCDDIGQQQVTLTVWDNLGVSASCTSIVSVNDNITPSITCTANIVVNTDFGCDAFVSVDVPVVSDNCGIEFLLNDYNGTDDASGIYPVGVTTIAWTITDLAGNINVCVQEIMVVDTEVPNAMCADIDLSLDIVGNAFITPSDIDAGSADNCGIFSMTVEPNSFTSADLGENVVVLIVTDESDNSSTCSSVVTVTDLIPPTAICIDTTVYLDALGQVQIDTTFVDNGSFDNGEIVSITVSPDAFDCSVIGVNMVTLMVTDQGGLIGTCTSALTVIDSISPVAICQPFAVNLDLNGNVAILPSDIDAGSVDNCEIASMTVVPNSFTSADLGDNVVVLIVIDESGNSSTCSAVVTVTDDGIIHWLCTDLTVYLDQNGYGSINPYDIFGLDSSSYYLVDTVYASQTEFGCDDLGENQVIATVIDTSGLSDQCVSTVTVILDMGGYLTCPADIVVEADTSSPGSCETFVSNPEPDFGFVCGVYEVFNDYTGTNDASGIYMPGITTVTWTISNNGVPVFTCEQTIEVIDSVGSYLICAEDVVVDAIPGDECNTPVTVPAPEWMVSCGIGVLTNDYNGTDDASDIYTLGTTMVNWTLNINGNPAFTCSQIVGVIPLDVVFVCPSDIIQSNDPGICEAVVNVPLPEVSNVCGGYEISNNYTETNDASGTYPVGETMVSWILDINQMPTFTCNQIITVLDIEVPITVCNDLTVTLDSSNNVTIFPDDVDSGSSDNCGIFSMTLLPNSFTSADLGDNTVVLTVFDESGNSSSCTAVVTVDQIDAVAEQALVDFSYYPNPNNGSFILTNQGANGEYLLELIELSGKTVYSEKLELSANTTKTVKTNQLNKGVYLVKLTDTKENFSRTLRMIVN